MKRFSILFLFLTLSTFAQEPIPVAKHNLFRRAVGSVASNFVGMFKDLKDPEWALAFGIDTVAQSLDTGSTCYNLGPNRVEGGIIARGSRNCGVIAPAQFAVHFSKWAATHAFVKEMINQCERDKERAALGEGPAYVRERWKTDSPKSCKHSMWIGDITVGTHISNTVGNLK